jgi:hypothetical protein
MVTSTVEKTSDLGLTNDERKLGKLNQSILLLRADAEITPKYYS